MATYPNPACHNNPARDKTQPHVQASISKEGSEATSLPLMASPTSPAPRPQDSQGPPQLSPPLHLFRQTLPRTHISTPTTQPQDSHGPLQFLILDGAVQSLGREEQSRAVWVNPGGRGVMYPNARAQSPPPHKREKAELRGRAVGRNNQEGRLWNRALEPGPSVAALAGLL